MSKPDIIAKTDVLVVGGTMAHRRGVAQMIFAGLQVMQGGAFKVQINCPDTIKCHVTAGDGAETALRGLEVINLQLASAAHPYLNSADEVDNFEQPVTEGSKMAEFIQRAVADRQAIKRDLFNRDVELVMTHGQEIIPRENLAEYLEDLNREELIAYITNLAAVVDKFVGPIKDPAAPKWTLRVSETSFDIKIPNSGLSGITMGPGGSIAMAIGGRLNAFTGEPFEGNHPHMAENILTKALSPSEGGISRRVNEDHGIDGEGNLLDGKE